ncbi:porin [[Haemophilus] ducreyi]|uniref:porin n=1 Tax=Haemophilus ducreyi TaxID=730 RepID=UPI0021C27E3E|nr:porin [[Haemophilus] ducreyi]
MGNKDTKTAVITKPRKLNNIELSSEFRNAFAVGLTYETKIADNTLNIDAGFGRSNYQSAMGEKQMNHHQDGYEAAVGYQIDKLKLVSDFGYARDGADTLKAYYFAPGIQYQITPVSKVYGNYLYERVKFNKEDVKNTSLFSMSSKSTSLNQKSHGFLLGADYQLHKHVLVFLEGKVVNKKYDDVVMQSEHRNTLFEKESYSFNAKNVDKVIGVGYLYSSGNSISLRVNRGSECFAHVPLSLRLRLRHGITSPRHPLNCLHLQQYNNIRFLRTV